MEKERITDENEVNNAADKEVCNEGTEQKKLYTHRGIGECLSKGISLLTDNFKKFTLLSLPVALPLSVVMAIMIYFVCDMTFMLGAHTTIHTIYVIMLLGFILFILLDAVIYKQADIQLNKQETISIKIPELYKSLKECIVKSALYNIFNVLYFTVALTVVVLVFTINTEDIGPTLIKCFFSLVVFILFVVFRLPFEISYPYIMLNDKYVWKRFFKGYKLGLKKIGKIISLSLIIFIITSVIACLLISPAIVIAMIQHSSTTSILEGDVVNLPDNFEIYALSILFISSFLSSYLIGVIRYPMVYLYASLKTDYKLK